MGIDGSLVAAGYTVADFRTTMPKAYDRVYAAGTTQNHPNTPGLYRFLLSSAWDTRRHPDGNYRLELEAADIRGNTTTAGRRLQLANSAA